MNIRMQTLEFNILNLRLFNETVAERMDKFEEKIEILGNLVQNLSSSTMTNVFSLKENSVCLSAIPTSQPCHRLLRPRQVLDSNLVLLQR